MPPLWQAERSVDPEQGKALIEQHFPELAPVRIRLFGEGWDNIAYLVNEEFVFRFPRRHVAVPLIRAENSLLRFIAPQVPLPVPLPLFCAQASDPYGWPFLGYRRLPGITACSADFAADDRERMARPLGEFLRALHSLPIDEARRLGAEPDKIGKLDIPFRIEKTHTWLKQIDEKQLLSDATRKKIDEIIADVSNVEVPATSVLLHGDLYARHLLVSNGKLNGIIDWGDVSLGHPAIDLAILFSLLPESCRQEFVDAYGDIDEVTRLLARFRAVSHTSAVLAYAAEVADDALVKEAMLSFEHLIS